MKSSDDSLLKPLDLIKLGRRRHLEIASANQGFVQSMFCNDVDWTSTQCCWGGSGTTRNSVGAIGVLGSLRVNILGLVHGPISSLSLAADDAHQDNTLRLMESALISKHEVT